MYFLFVFSLLQLCFNLCKTLAFLTISTGIFIYPIQSFTVMLLTNYLSFHPSLYLAKNVNLIFHTGSANTRTSPPHTRTAGTSSPLVCNPSVSNPVSEHRGVFNYASRGFTLLSRRQKGKKKITTCTLKFFCLGSKDDEKPPSTIVGKAALANCGLGPASITCDVNAMSIHEYLCDRYRPLSAAGGYEPLLLQRGGEDRGFCKLPPPDTPMKLKDIAGQVHIYIRPLQKNIYMENQDANIEQVEVSDP